MSSGLSDYAVQQFLNSLCGKGTFTPPTTFSVRCFTTSPGRSNSGGVEVSSSGTNYAAQSVANNTTNFPAVSLGTRSATYAGAKVDFGTTTAAWGTVAAVGWFDTSGNLWFLTDGLSQVVPSGADVYFNPNDLTLTIN